MRVGDLRHRVTIQTPPTTRDAYGGFTGDWTDVKEVWAAIWPTSAKEQLQGGQQTMTITHRVRMRYHTGITSAMRLKYGTRFFNVVSIVNWEERGVYLDLLCREAA